MPANRLSPAAVALCGAALLPSGCAGADDAPLPEWEFCPDLVHVEEDLLYVPGVKLQIYALHMEARFDGAERRTYWIRASAPMDHCIGSADVESSLSHRHIIEFLQTLRASESAELTSLRCCNVADFLETACTQGQFSFEAGRRLRMGVRFDIRSPESNLPMDLSALASEL